MFKRLLDRLKPKEKAIPIPSSEQTPADDELITVFDKYGQEVRISRSEWCEKVLIPNLKEKWDAPDELYQLILSGLNDGFVAVLEDSTNRLLVIDPIIERSHVIRGIVLTKLNRLDDAKTIMNAAIDKIGPTGTLLTNLAKVEAERGHEKLADDLLWQAIQLDPNQSNGLVWWLSIQQERDGEKGYLKALEKAAMLQGSWLPQLWLARHHLESGNISGALNLYRDVLASGTYSSEALMMISGDLGNNNQVPMIVDLVAPVFDTSAHDPRAGMNLLQAYIHLGRREEGEALLSRLYALNLTPYKQHLDYYSEEFQKLHMKEFPSQPIDEQQMKIVTIPFDMPIWMYGLREPKWLFSPKPATAKRVLFMSFAKHINAGDKAEQQREDTTGRLTRSLPLYLAEAVHYWTEHEGHTYIPIVQGSGPVVFGDSGSDIDTIEQLADNNDYVVLGTIDDSNGRLRISCRLWNCHLKKCLTTKEIDVPEATLGAAVLDLEKHLLEHLGDLHTQPHDPFYLRPSVDAIDPYLAGLGQNLMLSLVANGLVSRESMWGERNMLEWPLRIALHWPGADVPKLMFLASLSNAAAYKSDLLPEFKLRTLELTKDCRSTGNPIAQLEPLVWKVFGMEAEIELASKNCKTKLEGEEYCAWLTRVAATPAAEH